MMLSHQKSALFFCLFLGSVLTPNSAFGQEEKDPGLLTLDRLFASKDFQEEPVKASKWLKKKTGYTTLENSKENQGYQDLVRHDPETGKKEVLVPARNLIPPGRKKPLRVESYSWSPHEGQLLIFTNSRRVWRRNTRGDYWVYDLGSRELYQLGKDAPPSTLMFAKFSPDGKKVAYVRENNVYVEDLSNRKITKLTQAEGPHIVNGTFDWVYEEELDLRDGIRWSPDSRKIAYWQLDTSGVGNYYLVNNTAGIYQKLTKFQYPKVGTKNSAGRVGVVNIDGKSPTSWMKVPGDPRNHYIARMDWADNSEQIVLQQLNRQQNENKVILANAKDGNVATIFVEKDKAWVDVHDHLTWLDKGQRFTWLSERDGWRHLYVISRNGEEVKVLTPGPADVIDVEQVDEPGGWVYYYASPKNATQKYLFRANLDGSKQERLTPESMAGTHNYQISPDCKYAIHTYSTFDNPPVTNLVSLPGHKVIRTLAENKKLFATVKALKRQPVEFFKVDIAKGFDLDGWCIKPHNFDPSKKYPILFHVYGEPAGQTVLDTWTGSRYLWHLMMAQKGYVVVSVDNRGTPAPRGREFRKVVYRQVGILAPRDQATAATSLLRRWPWADGKRVGIWGWSGGGSMSLHAIFRYPELYSTAMSIAPVSNERYYDTIYQERYMGLPKDNPEGYRKGSPITYARQLRGNLLLVHGTADDNVHYANAEEIFNELIAANKQFTMLAYPNRSHSISEGTNTRRHLFTLLTNYLMEKMPPGPGRTEPSLSEKSKN